MAYRKCQWCEKDIYNDISVHWFTVVSVTGLAYYFDTKQCLKEWVNHI